MSTDHTIGNIPEDQNVSIKLFSMRSIMISTFWGGPIAAGYLARRNYINLGKAVYGTYSLIIGVAFTLLIYVGIFSLPESIMNKIPNLVIPGVYMMIIYLAIENLQGKELKEHAEKNGEFYSAWKAVGIGAIGTVIMFGGVMGYVLLSNSDFDAVKYDNGMAEFSSNEEKALELFNFIDTASSEKSIEFINKKGIPAWESNIKILADLDKIDGLHEKLFEQDQILKNYCNLRIEQYQLMKKAVTENMDVYNSEIERVIKLIDAEVAKLNK